MRARSRRRDGRIVLAEALVERVLGEGAEVLDALPRRARSRAPRYEPPFPFIAGSEYGERGHTVLPADFVTAEDGTGLVHTAIAFGEDDFRLGEQYGLNVVNPVRLDGTYDERIGPYAGRCVKDADPDLIEDLRARGRLLRAETLRARLSALLALRHAAALLREAVLVHPHDASPRPAARGQRDGQLAPAARQARALRQVAGEQRRLGAVARALLGHAAAGVALRGSGHVARDRLVRRAARSCSGVRAGGPAPAVRRRGRRSPAPSAASTMRRVPEVIDVWFDSGAMPFAQYHAPFENARARSSERFPADFICEALDQTRGWFYSLLADLDAAVRPAPTATSSASA